MKSSELLDVVAQIRHVCCGESFIWKMGVKERDRGIK